MMLALPLGLLGALLQGPGSDTTVSVRPETRLEVHNLGGDIVIRTWERNTVRVQAEHASRDVVEISYSGAVLRVNASNRRGGPHSIDYTITVPAAMDLNLSGTYSDVTVEHSAGRVVVETVQGDVTVHGGKGLVNLHSVSGDVRVSGVTGRLEANSTNGEVMVDDADGEVNAETVNGDVTLRNIRSDNVSAVTVNGDIIYGGTVRDNGQYRLSTHNGDVTMTIPTGANATVSVSTFNGDFESDFPVTLSGTRKGKRFNFTIGSGSATLELESFEGSIRLIRP